MIYDKKTDDELVEWMDNADYVELLDLWRYAHTGFPLFVGEMGERYKRVMADRLAEGEKEWPGYHDACVKLDHQVFLCVPPT